jgi:hypothetical protein
VILYAKEVATVAVKHLLSIQRLIPHASYSIIGWISVSKPIGHDEVNKIPRVNPLCEYISSTGPA